MTIFRSVALVNFLSKRTTYRDPSWGVARARATPLFRMTIYKADDHRTHGCGIVALIPGARNDFLGEPSGPCIWGRRNVYSGDFRASRGVGDGEGFDSLRSLNRICGLAARLKPCPSLSRVGRFFGWIGILVWSRNSRFLGFARDDNFVLLARAF
jgi:hypothetical protein